MDVEKRARLIQVIQKFHKQNLSEFYSQRKMTIELLESCSNEFVFTNHRCEDIESHEWFKAVLSFSRFPEGASQNQPMDPEEEPLLKDNGLTLILRNEVVVEPLWHGIDI